jgi:cellulose synthase/poly-beta-1,6-N-acetylglucosamine synthase-like glycosyltransferase
MKLSFVIPAYNEADYIESCLEAIIAQKHELEEQKKVSPGDIEIVVVNNASTDSTEDVVKKYKEVTLVNESKKGIVYARRAGFMKATGNLIANIDADTRISPDWIKKVLSEFSKDSKLVGLSGPFIYYDAPFKVRFFTRVFNYIGFFFYVIIRFVLHVGSILQGGNFVVRRDAIEKIGGYDTSISFYGEDTDVARRLSKIGHVKFTFNLPAFSSGRRLAKEGGITTGLRYAINILWITFFKKPISLTYSDIRLKNKNEIVYDPNNKWRERILATIFIIIFIAILAAIGYVISRVF